MPIAEIEQTLCEREKELARKEAQNELLDRQIADLEKRLADVLEQAKIHEGAKTFLEDLAATRRGALKGKIEGIVTDALRVLYGDSYRVEMSYSSKNNRSCLDIEMVRDTPSGEVRREIGGFGGGVADTISVPLRLMVLVGAKETDKVVMLDECWKHVDLARVDAVGGFLRTIRQKLGLQVVMCTHLEGLKPYADRIFEVTEKDGQSRVKRVDLYAG